jgi:hypothetical protein
VLSRPVLAGGAVIVLLGAVALASSGRGPGAGDEGSRSVSSGWIDVVFTLALVGMVVTILLLVASMRLRREDDSDFGLKQMLVVAVVLVALFGAIALAATFLGGESSGEVPTHLDQGPGARNPGSSQPRGPRPSAAPAHDAGLSWPTVAVVAILGAAVVAATVGRSKLRRRRRRRREREAVEAVRAVIQDALDELASGDPRVAVIAAFAGMERTLGLHGLPRRPAEGPLEYTERVLTELRASAHAAAALAVLFERARFSTHEIDEPDRNEAVRALSAVRDELGEAA